MGNNFSIFIFLSWLSQHWTEVWTWINLPENLLYDTNKSFGKYGNTSVCTFHFRAFKVSDNYQTRSFIIRNLIPQDPIKGLRWWEEMSAGHDGSDHCCGGLLGSRLSSTSHATIITVLPLEAPSMIRRAHNERSTWLTVKYACQNSIAKSISNLVKL